jgi:hypothetical protein
MLKNIFAVVVSTIFFACLTSAASLAEDEKEEELTLICESSFVDSKILRLESEKGGTRPAKMVFTVSLASGLVYWWSEELKRESATISDRVFRVPLSGANGDPEYIIYIRRYTGEWSYDANRLISLGICYETEPPKQLF